MTDMHSQEAVEEPMVFTNDDCSHQRLKQERKCVYPSIPNGFHLHVFWVIVFV